jgi:hypothetical protein
LSARIATLQVARGSDRARRLAGTVVARCLDEAPGLAPTLILHVGSFRDEQWVEPAEAPLLLADLTSRLRPQLAFDVDHLIAALQLATRWVETRRECALVVTADRAVQTTGPGPSIAAAAGAILLATGEEETGFRSFHTLPSTERAIASELDWDAAGGRHELRLATPPSAVACRGAARAAARATEALGVAFPEVAVCATQRGPHPVDALRELGLSASQVPRCRDGDAELHSAGPLFAWIARESGRRDHLWFTVEGSGRAHLAHYRESHLC